MRLSHGDLMTCGKASPFPWNQCSKCKAALKVLRMGFAWYSYSSMLFLWWKRLYLEVFSTWMYYHNHTSLFYFLFFCSYILDYYNFWRIYFYKQFMNNNICEINNLQWRWINEDWWHEHLQRKQCMHLPHFAGTTLMHAW